MKKFDLKYILILILITSCAGSKPEISEDFRVVLKDSKEKLNYIDTNMISVKARELVISGSTFEQKREYARAVIEFQRALRYDTTAAIFYAIAKNHHKLNIYNIALENLIKAVELKPDFVPALELMAEVYTDQFNLDKAAKTYEEILKYDDDRKYKLYLGRIYQIQDTDKAIKIYEELLDEYESPDVLSRLSELYSKKGMEEKALEINKKLFKYNPDFYSAMPIIQSYVMEDNYEAAMEFLGSLEKDLTLEEVSGAYQYIGGNMLEDTAEVNKKFKRELIEKFDSKFYFNERIQLIGAYLAHDIDSAELRDQFFQRALKVADTIPDMPLQISMFYSFNELEDKAVRLLEKYGNEFPDDYRFPFYTGMVKTQAGKLREALEYNRQAYEMDSTKVEVITQFGIIYDQLDIQDSSFMAYEKALELDPDDALANNNYAYSISESGGDLEKAKKMSEKALEQNPENSAYLDTYGWILHKMGKDDEALEYIEKAIDAGGASAEVYDHLGDILYRLGRKDDALKAWEQSLKMDPERDQVKKKMDELK